VHAHLHGYTREIVDDLDRTVDRPFLAELGPTPTLIGRRSQRICHRHKSTRCGQLKNSKTAFRDPRVRVTSRGNGGRFVRAAHA
jgi:hypothetical protein